MKIDLHIHTATGSDGAMSIEEVFAEAAGRGIEFISITDHDNIDYQELASELAAKHGIRYLNGVELNVTFPYRGKDVSLDFLGYGYDYNDKALKEKLLVIREHRQKRALQIMTNLNAEFVKEDITMLTEADLRDMQAGVDGVLGRPHIADFLIKKGIVVSRQEAFDKYLVRCDVPKYPLYLEEASAMVRGAGGRLALAHPADPHGTSLVSITGDLEEQTQIIAAEMLRFIDGVECWHSRAAAAVTEHYAGFCRKHGRLMTGGSDCHQKPVIMGTVPVPDFVADQFSPPGTGR
ncbi:MAG: PHP domain-containing protein [Dehalococcoidales bacterium]|nr:PHP domain-containing protein [Dehalococcoidales bacterium]